MPVITCQHCDYARMPMEGAGADCPRCGGKYSVPAKPRPEIAQPVRLPTDPVDRAWALGQFSDLTDEQLSRAAARVSICTLETLPGHTVDAVLGLVSGSYTIAFGAIFEAFAGMARNFAGTGASTQTEQHISCGIDQVVGQMRGRTLALFGANAVVGIRYQFQEFSGANGKGILAVIGTGTAVKASLIQDQLP